MCKKRAGLKTRPLLNLRSHFLMRIRDFDPEGQSEAAHEIQTQKVDQIPPAVFSIKENTHSIEGGHLDPPIIANGGVKGPPLESTRKWECSEWGVHLPVKVDFGMVTTNFNFDDLHDVMGLTDNTTFYLDLAHCQIISSIKFAVAFLKHPSSNEHYQNLDLLT